MNAHAQLLDGAHTTIQKGFDIGSSMIVIFSDKKWHVIVGHSKGDRVWKFPCGKIEQHDGPMINDPEDTTEEEVFDAAQRCVLRELEAEVGLNANDLSFFQKIDYTRTLHPIDRLTQRRKSLRQFHFIGITAEETALPGKVEEQDEMDARAYWSVQDVFRHALKSRYTENKFNPFHAIALVESLCYLKDIIKGDPAFNEFHALIMALEKENLHIETLANELRDLIKAGAI